MSEWFVTYGYADVLDQLLVGAYPLDENDVAMLSAIGVQRVLNLTEDREYRDGERDRVEQALAGAGIEEHRLPMPDFGDLPVDSLERAVDLLGDWLDEGARVYVHCRAGWQRSPAVAAAVIAARDDISIGEALELVRSRKPTADPLRHQRHDLLRWWRERGLGDDPPDEERAGSL